MSDENKAKKLLGDIHWTRYPEIFNLYLLEMHRQLTISKSSFRDMINALNENDPSNLFAHLAASQHAATQAISIVWPGKSGKETSPNYKNRMLRARWLRIFLRLSDDDLARKPREVKEDRDPFGNSKFSSFLRHSIAHFDERLDTLIISKSDRPLHLKEKYLNGYEEVRRIYAEGDQRFYGESFGERIETYVSVSEDAFQNQKIIASICSERHDLSDFDNKIMELIGNIEHCIDNGRIHKILIEAEGDLDKAEGLDI